MNIIFDFIRDIFAIPFGYLMGFFYNISGSYILATILLTILVRLCFVPSAINQHKDTIKAKQINTKIQHLRNKYGDDKETLAKEIQALQAKEAPKNKNLGCITTFVIQFAVMIGLFNILYTPLTNVLQIEDATIEAMKQTMPAVVESIGEESNMLEISLLTEAENYKEALLSNNILTVQELNEIITFHEKYTFLGVDLSMSPELTELNALWLIPLLVLATGVISAIYSHIKRKKRNPGKGKFTVTDGLPFISPLMMFGFAFMFPAGVGLYWALTSFLAFIQTVVLNIIYNPDKLIASEEPKIIPIETLKE